jgi:hypothetical protein
MSVATLLVMFLVMAVVNWALLLVVVPIAQSLTHSTMLPWGEAWWKLGVVAVAVTLVTVLLQSVGILRWVAEGIVLWVFLWRWFDTEWLGLVIIVLGKGILGILALFAFLAVLSH